MSSPTNQQPHQLGTLRQALVDAIDRYLVDGLPVYDVYGDKVGHVKLFSMTAGYLLVGHGPLALEDLYIPQDLYIPFRLIRSIDPHDIFLTETKDTLESTCTEPPTVRIVEEHRLVPGPHGTMTPQTCQVQVVQSGYDDQPAACNRVDLNSIAERLAVGMVVYDITGERLGDLTQYDVARSLLVVEKGIFRPRVLFVPFSAIQVIFPGTFRVYLSVPRAVLMKQQGMLPADTLPPADT